MIKPIVIPGAFDPTYSPLGRRLRRGPDRLQAEARYYLYAVTGIVLLILTGFLSWAIFREPILSDAGGIAAVTFFAAQLIAWVGFSALCIVGFRPPTRITISGRTVRLVQGTSTLAFRIPDIVDTETVPALTFHRTYRLHAGLREFPGRRPENYLLIRTSDLHVALGLAEGQRLELVGALEKWPTDSEPELVGVAR